VETRFAWDWAAPVPELLQAAETRYLVGYETLGWAEGGGWAYILPDALGSIRQTADAAGAVTRAREWTPYGEEVGPAQAGPGYTGEWWDAEVGLLYLRARWYAPGVGRFTQIDPHPGNVWLPSSLHRYVYVRNNPVFLTDPSGLAPFPPFFRFPGPTVGELIDFFDWLYRKDGFLNCSSLEDSQSPFDSAWDLFVDFVCEYGPDTRTFDADAPLTHELAMSILVHEKLRLPLYQHGLQQIKGREMRFNVGEFMLATGDWGLFIPSQWLNRLLSSGIDMPVNITHFLGSWDTYEVTRLGPRMASFVITNQTDRSSGSRIPGRFSSEYVEPLYLERMAQKNESLRSAPALPLIIFEPRIVSILEPKYRSDTKDPEGGGMMWQTFSWTERLRGCGAEWKLPPPIVWHFIEIKLNSGKWVPLSSVRPGRSIR